MGNIQVTLNSVRNDIKKKTRFLSSILSSLEALVIEGRDRVNNPIPIALTKYRVKSYKSAYLKIIQNHKVSQTSDLTDLAGIRILCLFEQDILITYSFLLDLLQENDYQIEKIKIYNWHEHSFFSDLKKMAHKHRIEIKHKPKLSGYKSIHFILMYENNHIEMQLRTLLQDVWGELEHKLNYKGGSNTHPHITKSFEILASDLNNIDSLLSHLKKINDLENSGYFFTQEQRGPTAFFTFDDDVASQPWMKDNIEDFQKYLKMCDCSQLSKKDFLEAKKLIAEIVGSNISDQAIYFQKMELAYLSFKMLKLDEALIQYEDILRLKKFGNRSILFFRKGELELQKGNLETAIACFNAAEKYCSNCTTENQFLFLTRLSYTYWLLGTSFFTKALDKACDAEKLLPFESTEDDITEIKVRENYIANLLCWYNLELFCTNFANQKKYECLSKDSGITDEHTIAKENAEKYFNKSEIYADKLVNGDSDFAKNRNQCDTLAWFFYQKSLYLNAEEKAEEKYDSLKKAHKYCVMLLSGTDETRAVLKMMSNHIMREHIQIIEDACNQSRGLELELDNDGLETLDI